MILACISCTRYARSIKKKIFRTNDKVDQINQNLVLLLSIRRKLIIRYCFKVDHVLKFLNFCTSSNLSFRTLVKRIEYKSSKTSKQNQLWNSTVQSVFIWLIKTKRDFNELDQLYNFFEKNFFLVRWQIEYKRCMREKNFFSTRK